MFGLDPPDFSVFLNLECRTTQWLSCLEADWCIWRKFQTAQARENLEAHTHGGINWVLEAITVTFKTIEVEYTPIIKDTVVIQVLQECFYTNTSERNEHTSAPYK